MSFHQKHIVIVGSNFAGFTAAIELKRALKDRHRVTVVSKTHEFLFTPSLVLLAFGKRTRSEITFSMREPFAKNGIGFREEEVTRLDLENHRVLTRTGEERYDHLVIATGPKANYGAVPGLGPRGYTQSIVSMAEAEQAAVAFERLLKAPGPVVVGEAPGASCFGAARDFLLNTAQQLAHRGPKVPLTWLTAERLPFTAKVRGVQSVTNAVLQEVSPEELCLADGRKIPFAYAMIIPSFLGVDAVRACEAITNASGFVLVNDCYQCGQYPEVFAAGVAAALEPSIPKSGQLAEEMGKVVAHNITAQLEGREMVSVSPAKLAAQCANVTTNSVESVVEPSPSAEARWAKLALEKYFPGAR